MAKRRAEDFDEAFCYVTAWLDPELSENVEHVAIDNRGKVTARPIKAHVEIVGKSIPENRVLSRVSIIDIHEEELAAPTASAINANTSSKSREVPLEWMNSAMRSRMADTKATIVVSGTLEYENGFGVVKNSPFCISSINAKPEFGNGGTNNLIDCDKVPRFLRDLERTHRAHAEERKKQQ